MIATSTKKIHGDSHTKDLIENKSYPVSESGSRRSNSVASILYKSQKYLLSKQLIGMNYKKRRFNYHTGDVLVCCGDPAIRSLLVEYFSRMRVRSHDPLDEGRNLVCEGVGSPDMALERIVGSGNTYGFIVCDLFFGHESMCSRELVRQLRFHGYPGAIVYLSDSGLGDSCVEEHFMGVGADALLIKGTKTMKIEFQRLVTDIVKREEL